MSPCPVCHREGSLLLIVASGFWERHVLLRLGVRPYRCRACGNRILKRQSRQHGFDESLAGGRSRSDEARPKGGRRGTAGSSSAGSSTDGSSTDGSNDTSGETSERFLAPQDKAEFEELIGRLKKTEVAHGLEAQTGPAAESHDV